MALRSSLKRISLEDANEQVPRPESPAKRVVWSRGAVHNALTAMDAQDLSSPEEAVAIEFEVRPEEYKITPRPTDKEPNLARTFSKNNQLDGNGCCSGIVNCFIGLCASETEDFDSNCWKLVHERLADPTSDPEQQDLNDMRWGRRRHFFLKDSVRSTRLSYISEKDGRMVLAAVIARKGVHAKISPLQPIYFGDVDAATSSLMVASLQQHAIAFSDDGVLHTMEEFQDQVPKQLFPAEITWRDAPDDEEHKIVMAWVSSGARNNWCRVMNKKKC